MKWMGVTRNPIGWSDGAAKTPLRVIIFSLFHVACFAGGMVAIHKHGVSAGYLLLFYSGVGLPALYLIAIHQLLKLLREARGCADRTSEEGTSL